MDFFEVVSRQRACRQFRPDPVDDTLLERILTAATFAPSAENRQPWVFVVIREPTLRAAVGALGERAWESGGRQYSVERLSPELLADVDRGVRGGVAGAPVIIVVCVDTQLAHRSSVPASVFPAIQNLLLAAGAEGLGSAMTTLPLAGGGELAGLLELPETVQPLAVVPVGWPARALGPPRRQPIGDKAYRDTWRTPW
jgi:nitroreductase